MECTNEITFIIHLSSSFSSFYSFKVQSYVTTDSQPGSLSWNKAPIWGLQPDLDYCLTVAGLLIWGALSDERMGLPTGSCSMLEWKQGFPSLSIQSQSQSYIRTDGQSASMSWNKAPIWGLRPDLCYCQTVAGVFMFRRTE
jgi:hypothetical protein